jgi:hypothetical protein
MDDLDIKVLVIADTLADAKEIKNLFRRTGAVLKAIQEIRVACEEMPDEDAESEERTYRAIAPYLERMFISLIQTYRSPNEMDRDITAIKGFVDKTGLRGQG